jgi:23S rRNA G2069 N7-methylase RlmK/C1962 C5-methylase RlmI
METHIKRAKLEEEEEERSNSVDELKLTAEITESYHKRRFFREHDVGIYHYVHPELVGFQGTIKQRYSDFLVYELDSKQQVAHLTHLQPLETAQRFGR